MTLSNFDWTDKASVKWFLMLSTGHEGPYSLDTLIQKKVSPEVKIWAEGLAASVSLKEAIERAEDQDDDLPPPLPPLPEDGEVFPEFGNYQEVPAFEEELVELKAESKSKKTLGLGIGILLLVGFGFYQWISSQEKFSIRRATRMSPEIFNRINKDFKFEGWGKKLFFKEYVPADMSHIWLATSGFEHCRIEAQFSSLPGKLLAVEDEKVSFKSSGELDDHLVEFSKFDFSSGNKIIPGLYEMDLKATDCKWGSLPAKIANLFETPSEEYVTRMKVVLYHKGSVEFNAILDKLIRKKMDLEVKNQNQEELFWQDLQQKLQTLLAISLQIEQLLLEFTEMPAANFKVNLKTTVDRYTKKFGGTLTEFVVQNEKYFEDLEKSELSNMSLKRSYESTIKLTSKNIGFESMKLIEELQSWKKPTQADLGRMGLKIKKQFAVLKDSVNQNIIQITEDRSK